MLSRGGEGGSTSLADWAEQLGQSEMLAALSASASASTVDGSSGGRSGSDSTAPERDANRNNEEDSSCGAAAATVEGGEEGGWRGRGGAGGRGEVPGDVGLFVEELRVREGQGRAGQGMRRCESGGVQSMRLALRKEKLTGALRGC